MDYKSNVINWQFWKEKKRQNMTRSSEKPIIHKYENLLKTGLIKTDI